jgi:hypothetical protein
MVVEVVVVVMAVVVIVVMVVVVVAVIVVVVAVVVVVSSSKRKRYQVQHPYKTLQLATGLHFKLFFLPFSVNILFKTILVPTNTSRFTTEKSTERHAFV